MEPVREALIVAADTYADVKLGALRAPVRDAEELARVLADPEIGDFRVHVSLNEPDHVVRRRLSEFFRDRGRDDLLLLHVSGHGLKDEDGTLYFATSNTEVDHLEATAVPSEFVNRQMARSLSRRIVLLLDCCFGGAFARGFVARAGDAVEVGEKFDGRGRVVLTASRAMEYAFEGDQLAGEAHPSIFTSALVEGLETGKADRDGDSRISVDELYEYVYDQVRDATPNQTPSKWTFDVEGELYVARSRYRAPVEPAELPLELRAAIESPFANVRVGAVEELALLLRGSSSGLAMAARGALEQLVGDDSRRVSLAAATALGEETAEETAPPAPAPAPAPALPRRRPEAARRTSTIPELALVAVRARRFALPLALVGAAALVAGYFWPGSSLWTPAGVGWSEGSGGDSWLVWSPVEAFGVALLVAVSALAAARRPEVRGAPVDGLLLAVGTVTFLASIAEVHAFGSATSTNVTMLGALAIAASAALGMLTRRPAEAQADLTDVVVAAVAGLLVLASIRSGLYPLTDADYSYYLELVGAGALGLVAAYLLRRAPRARVYAAGMLFGAGLQVSLHWLATLAYDTKHDEWPKPSLALGLLGAGFLVGAGIRPLRLGRRGPAPAGGRMGIARVPGSAARLLPLVAAAAIVAAFFWPGGSVWSASQTAWSSYDNYSWFVWSPVEAGAIAALVVAVTVAGLRRSFWLDAARDGFLLALGVLTFVAGIALSQSDSYEASSADVTMLGALVLAASALPGLLSRRAERARPDLFVLVATAAGAALLLASLFVSEKPFTDGEYRKPFGELAVGVALALVCLVVLVVLPRFRLHAAGVLLGAGVQLCLHWAAILVFLDHVHEASFRRSAFAAGLLGAALLLAAGARLLSVARREAVVNGGSPEAPPAPAAS